MEGGRPLEACRNRRAHGPVLPWAGPLRAYNQIVTTYLDRLWRQGRKRKDNGYLQVGPEPSDDDMPVFVALGPSDAAEAVAHRIVTEHNEALDRASIRAGWSGLDQK